MKITNAFLIWWLRWGRYAWSKLRRKIFERGYTKIELPVVNSPGEIEACLKQITWTMDGPFHLFDCISYPQTTWVKKKDDCDGFATLAAELLTQSGPQFNPLLITVMLRPIRSSHTVCAFNNAEGGISFFDNDSLRGNCATYHEVVEQISRSSKQLVCWDIRKHDTLEMIEFHKD